MTRRIGLAILISVWTMLVIGAIAAYVSVRTILVSDLDSLLYARAAGLPELVHPQGFDPDHTPQYDWADSYVIRPDPTRPPGAAATARPKLVNAGFSHLADGQRRRTVVISATASPRAGAPAAPVLVEYSGSMSRIELLLRRLRWALGGFVVVAGVLAAAVAMAVSRLVLRPLGSTAKMIAGIDERKLDARISPDALPSEFVPVARQLNELLDRMQRAFAGQKRFLADASHELRTPVAALETTLEIASRHPRDAESYRQTLAQCLSQVQVLHVLVERLMEYVSDGTAIPEEARETDVGALIGQCIDVAEALGADQQITITRAGPATLWCQIQPNRLRSILTNLLGNAVEHNTAGGKVEASWLHDGEQLRARIADTGPGIAPEHLPHVFTAFYRAEKSRRAQAGHLGLGLFIVHTHVRAMGGSCHVDSTPGEGTVFELDLPCPKLTRQNGGNGGNGESTPALEPAASA